MSTPRAEVCLGFATRTGDAVCPLCKAPFRVLLGPQFLVRITGEPCCLSCGAGTVPALAALLEKREAVTTRPAYQPGSEADDEAGWVTLGEWNR